MDIERFKCYRYHLRTGRASAAAPHNQRGGPDAIDNHAVALTRTALERLRRACRLQRAEIGGRAGPSARPADGPQRTGRAVAWHLGLLAADSRAA